MDKKRKLSYGKAIREAAAQVLSLNKEVFVIGQGVNSPWYVGNTTDNLVDEFGKDRIIDTPVSEAAVSGVANGAAIAGSRPILVFPRMDFMYLAMDQIINQSANWSYMFGGGASVPVVIRGIINRGGEQAAQHSQAIHSVFAHIPGLKVVMPATPYDAKGLLISAVEDDNPVVYIDDRWLYEEEGEVPENLYRVSIGKANILEEGADITVAALSYMVKESLMAAEVLKKEGISIEVVDLRSVKPLDEKTLLGSVEKTKRLIVADVGWESYGASAEISAVVGKKLFGLLKNPIERIALPDIPAPASSALEKDYYLGKENIIEKARKIMAK